MPGTKYISAKKQGERDALLKSTSVLKESEVVESTLNQFTDADAAAIVKNIRSRVPGWTATAVVTAYIRRAIVAHRELNYITEGQHYFTYTTLRQRFLSELPQSSLMML